MDEFLGYLAEWKKYVESDKSLSPADKAKMMLSRETLEGLTMTGKQDIVSTLYHACRSIQNCSLIPRPYFITFGRAWLAMTQELM